jgi:drug/metabolite transporter (DMT)-like permease
VSEAASQAAGALAAPPPPWLWIPISIAAALAQNLRTAVQRKLKGRLSTNGANYTRFVFGIPLAAGYVAALALWGGFALARPNARFAAAIAVGGVAQILGTSALLEATARRNFAAGIAFSKTEAVQAALFEVLVLGAALSAGAALAIAVATVGVLLISLARPGETGLRDSALWLGLASGGLYAISAVAFRAASLSLAHPSYLMSAACTLLGAQALQTVLLGAWLALREPGQLAAVRAHWRVASFAGVTGTLASAGWFTAMTLTVAAYVRTLGLVELLFTFAIGRIVFRETPAPRELAGAALLAAGIALLLNAS